LVVIVTLRNMDDLLASYASSSDAEVASKEEAEDELEFCEGEFL
jgi:hypothetical protein